MEDGYTWGDASVTYPDWVGTAQLDQRMAETIEQKFPQLAGWSVIGIDIGGGEHPHSLNLIAVPHDVLPDGGNVFARYAESNDGQIHATNFLVHDVDPYEFLRTITHMFELRLRIRSTENVLIRIRANADIPEQD